MKIFESEQQMLSTLEEYSQLVNKCVNEKITFQEFLERYDNFYFVYALDGHESDLDEQKTFEKHVSKINLHREIAEMLCSICSDEDADKEAYKEANRFGAKKAHSRLKEIYKIWIKNYESRNTTDQN